MPFFGNQRSWRDLEYGRVNNYSTYSSCKTKRAMKNYWCSITQKQIKKGEMYKELRMWNPYKRRYYTFKLTMDVSRETISLIRNNPEESRWHTKQKLGFFNA